MTIFNNQIFYYDIKSKKNIADNHVHNILRLFDVLPNFIFTTSETKHDY